MGSLVSAEDNPYDMDAEEIRTTGLPTEPPAMTGACANGLHTHCAGLTWPIGSEAPVDCECHCHTNVTHLNPPHAAAA